MAVLSNIITPTNVLTSSSTSVLTNKSFGDNPIFSAGVAGGVAYLNGSKVLTTGSALQFDGSNLGLGVTPSAWQSIYRAAQFPAGVSVVGRNDGGIEGIFATNAFRNSAGTWTYVNNGVARRYVQEADGHLWFTAPSGTAGNAISFTQAMTLDASGTLLAGLTSSTGTNPMRMQVKGGAGGANPLAGYSIISGNDEVAGHIVLASSGENSINISVDPQNLRASSSLQFSIDGTERARIDSSGNVGIGTTSTSSYKLTINGSLGATTITETSALALKENFRGIEDPLNKVIQLVGKIYDRKDGSNKNEVGLVADEVIKVIPELVKSDAAGNPEGVNYTRLTVYLLESIKALKQEINELKAR